MLPGEDVIYEIKVTKIWKGRKEELNHVKVREPYPDERTLTEEEKKKDPQYAYTRVMRDTEVSDVIFTQKVTSEIDMMALSTIINGKERR